MKVICVTGTPGTGKTTLAKKLAKLKTYEYIDVNKVIESSGLKESYDKKKKCSVIDVKKLNKVLIKLIKSFKGKGIVIDSHLSHYLSSKYVDLCVVTKCSNLKKLESRLKKRGYIKSKIRENLDCEIFDVCLNEAHELKHKIKVVDTSKRYKIEDVR
jgi:adenylate kinase